MIKAIFKYQRKERSLYILESEDATYKVAIEISHPRVKDLQFSTSSTYEIEFEPNLEPDPIWVNLYLGNITNTGEEQIIRGTLGTVAERERERGK